MARTGRPSKYTEELAQEICARLSAGTNLIQICRDAEMPNEMTVYRWTEKHPGFKSNFREARAQYLERMADELVDISDNGHNDWMLREYPNGRELEIPDVDHINRSRLRVDTRKWLLSKLKPERYGELIKHQHEQRVETMTQAQVDAQLEVLLKLKEPEQIDDDAQPSSD